MPHPAPKPATIAVLGDGKVGKSTFVDMFLHNQRAMVYDPTSSHSTQRLFTPSTRPPCSTTVFSTIPATTTTTTTTTPWLLTLTDLDTSLLFPSPASPALSLDMSHFTSTLARADGLVLLFDAADRLSYERITTRSYDFAWACRCASTSPSPSPSPRRFGAVLVSNLSLPAYTHDRGTSARAVPHAEAADWAASQGMHFLETVCLERRGCEEGVAAVLRGIEVAERMAVRERELEGAGATRGRGRGRERERRRGFRSVFGA